MPPISHYVSDSLKQTVPFVGIVGAILRLMKNVGFRGLFHHAVSATNFQSTSATAFPDSNSSATAAAARVGICSLWYTEQQFMRVEPTSTLDHFSGGSDSGCGPTVVVITSFTKSFHSDLKSSFTMSVLLSCIVCSAAVVLFNGTRVV